MTLYANFGRPYGTKLRQEVLGRHLMRSFLSPVNL